MKTWRVGLSRVESGSHGVGYIIIQVNNPPDVIHTSAVKSQRSLLLNIDYPHG